ncbi:MAG: hypothetical protein M1825_000393 [Sarcosagium campestre]|nr:MAG: hypothetical protein M1825_000393 [Sarcosagium campestre]
MARKARQRISYVLPLANSPGGHRLGVNGLAVDRGQSILYSAGRDGVICTWDLALDLTQDASVAAVSEGTEQSSASTSRRKQVQAHTHWVNDIVLAQKDTVLVSASSDLTVKVWRPDAADDPSPRTIGLHSDYVKRLATPRADADWVASGGLDHKIHLWDLNGGGERMQIDVEGEEKTDKGSVYALAVGGGILASGGPESIVRLWDPKSGKRVTKFVGHTDNVRDILITDDGDMVMTASSDQTVKVWSVTAGRCLHTLTMHNDSVWSLYSDHPQLAVFYSSDRSGLVAKTDIRGAHEMDEGLCVAVCQEQEGVQKVISAGSHVWTATSSSSINRWSDVDTTVEIQLPGPHPHRNSAATAARSRMQSITSQSSAAKTAAPRRQIPYKSVLQLSSNALYRAQSAREQEGSSIYSQSMIRRASEAQLASEHDVVLPCHALPEECIEGQNGLIKHILLNDRKRVLTLDTTGEVMMWDLVMCEPIRSFGKRHLEDVLPEVNTTESVANWCAVDTRTGSLACVLEEAYCFDAEMYADQLQWPGSMDFAEDQRIKLGKWVLRYLFSNLIDEEIRRDEAYRRQIDGNGGQKGSGMGRLNAPPPIELPRPADSEWKDLLDADAAGVTPRPANTIQIPTTPGLVIGVATPSGQQQQQPNQQPSREYETPLPSNGEEGARLEKRTSLHSQPRSSYDRSSDYFTSSPNPGAAEEGGGAAAGNAEVADERSSQPSADVEKDSQPKESGSLFGKKFRMSFGSKRLGKSSADASKPAVVDEKSEDSDEPATPDTQEEQIEDNLLGVVQSIRRRYTEQLREAPDEALVSGIAPSLPNETPVLKPPPSTSVIIQEDRPDSGGVADLYRGSVARLGQDASIIEKVAPMWLGELLLRNQTPLKETVKVSFVLLPYEDLLPSIASADGNARLNANRMLRARKILAYVAERMEFEAGQEGATTAKPEEFLELYCQDQLVSPTKTLSTLRAYVWKGGGDVVLYYKSNGRFKIVGERSASEVASASASDGTTLGNTTLGGTTLGGSSSGDRPSTIVSSASSERG